MALQLPEPRSWPGQLGRPVTLQDIIQQTSHNSNFNVRGYNPPSISSGRYHAPTIPKKKKPTLEELIAQAGMTPAQSAENGNAYAEALGVPYKPDSQEQPWYMALLGTPLLRTLAGTGAGVQSLLLAPSKEHTLLGNVGRYEGGLEGFLKGSGKFVFDNDDPRTMGVIERMQRGWNYDPNANFGDVPRHFANAVDTITGTPATRREGRDGTHYMASANPLANLFRGGQAIPNRSTGFWGDRGGKTESLPEEMAWDTLRLLRGTGNFAGELLTGPENYITWGTGGVAKESLRSAGRAAVEIGAEKAAREMAEQAAKEAAGEVAQTVAKEVATEGAEKLTKEAAVAAAKEAASASVSSRVVTLREVLERIGGGTAEEYLERAGRYGKAAEKYLDMPWADLQKASKARIVQEAVVRGNPSFGLRGTVPFGGRVPGISADDSSSFLRQMAGGREPTIAGTRGIAGLIRDAGTPLRAVSENLPVGMRLTANGKLISETGSHLAAYNLDAGAHSLEALIRHASGESNKISQDLVVRLINDFEKMYGRRPKIEELDDLMTGLGFIREAAKGAGTAEDLGEWIPSYTRKAAPTGGGAAATADVAAETAETGAETGSAVANVVEQAKSTRRYKAGNLIETADDLDILPVRDTDGNVIELWARHPETGKFHQFDTEVARGGKTYDIAMHGRGEDIEKVAQRIQRKGYTTPLSVEKYRDARKAFAQINAAGDAAKEEIGLPAERIEALSGVSPSAERAVAEAKPYMAPARKMKDGTIVITPTKRGSYFTAATEGAEESSLGTGAEAAVRQPKAVNFGSDDAEQAAEAIKSQRPVGEEIGLGEAPQEVAQKSYTLREANVPGSKSTMYTMDGDPSKQALTLNEWREKIGREVPTEQRYVPQTTRKVVDIKASDQAAPRAGSASIAKQSMDNKIAEIEKQLKASIANQEKALADEALPSARKKLRDSISAKKRSAQRKIDALKADYEKLKASEIEKQGSVVSAKRRVAGKTVVQQFDDGSMVTLEPTNDGTKRYVYKYYGDDREALNREIRQLMEEKRVAGRGKFPAEKKARLAELQSRVKASANKTNGSRFNFAEFSDVRAKDIVEADRTRPISGVTDMVYNTREQALADYHDMVTRVIDGGSPIGQKFKMQAAKQHVPVDDIVFSKRDAELADKAYKEATKGLARSGSEDPVVFQFFRNADGSIDDPRLVKESQMTPRIMEDGTEDWGEIVPTEPWQRKGYRSGQNPHETPYKPKPGRKLMFGSGTKRTKAGIVPDGVSLDGEELFVDSTGTIAVRAKDDGTFDVVMVRKSANLDDAAEQLRNTEAAIKKIQNNKMVAGKESLPELEKRAASLRKQLEKGESLTPRSSAANTYLSAKEARIQQPLIMEELNNLLDIKHQGGMISDSYVTKVRRAIKSLRDIGQDAKANQAEGILKTLRENEAVTQMPRGARVGGESYEVIGSIEDIGGDLLESPRFNKDTYEILVTGHDRASTIVAKVRKAAEVMGLDPEAMTRFEGRNTYLTSDGVDTLDKLMEALEQKIASGTLDPKKVKNYRDMLESMRELEEGVVKEADTGAIIDLARKNSQKYIQHVFDEVHPEDLSPNFRREYLATKGAGAKSARERGMVPLWAKKAVDEKTAQIVAEERRDIIETMASRVGKPVPAGTAQAKRLALENIPAMLKDPDLAPEAREALYRLRNIGGITEEEFVRAMGLVDPFDFSGKTAAASAEQAQKEAAQGLFGKLGYQAGEEPGLAGLLRQAQGEAPIERLGRAPIINLKNPGIEQASAADIAELRRLGGAVDFDQFGKPLIYGDADGYVRQTPKIPFPRAEQGVTIPAPDMRAGLSVADAEGLGVDAMQQAANKPSIPEQIARLIGLRRPQPSQQLPESVARMLGMTPPDIEDVGSAATRQADIPGVTRKWGWGDVDTENFNEKVKWRGLMEDMGLGLDNEAPARAALNPEDYLAPGANVQVPRELPMGPIDPTMRFDLSGLPDDVRANVEAFTQSNAQVFKKSLFNLDAAAEDSADFRAINLDDVAEQPYRTIPVRDGYETTASDGTKYHMSKGDDGQVHVYSTYGSETSHVGSFKNFDEAKEGVKTHNISENEVIKIRQEKLEEAITKIGERMGIDISNMDDMKRLANAWFKIEDDIMDSQWQLEEQMGFHYKGAPKVENYTYGGRQYVEQSPLQKLLGTKSRAQKQYEAGMGNLKPGTEIEWEAAGEATANKGNMRKVPLQSHERVSPYSSEYVKVKDTGEPYIANTAARIKERIYVGQKAMAKEQFIQEAGERLGRAYQLDPTGKWYVPVNFEGEPISRKVMSSSSNSLFSHNEKMAYQFADKSTRNAVVRIAQDSFTGGGGSMTTASRKWMIPLMMTVNPRMIVTNFIGNVALAAQEGYMNVPAVLKGGQLHSALQASGFQDPDSMAKLAQPFDYLGVHYDSVQEAAEHFSQLGIISHNTTDAYISGMDNAVGGWEDVPYLGRYFQKMRQANGAMEDSFRAGVALEAMARGKTAEEAAEVARTVMYDYSMAGLSGAERKIRQFVPFFTWARRNTPNMMTLPFRRPGVARVMYGNMPALSGMSYDEYGEELQKSPEYVRNNVPIFMESNDGTKRMVNTKLPFFDPMQIGAVGRELAQGDMTGFGQEASRLGSGYLGPEYKMISGLMSGVDADTGIPYQDLNPQLNPGMARAMALPLETPILGTLLQNAAKYRNAENNPAAEQGNFGNAVADTLKASAATQWPKQYDEQKWADQWSFDDQRKRLGYVKMQENRTGNHVISTESDVDTLLKQGVYRAMTPGSTPEQQQLGMLAAERLRAWKVLENQFGMTISPDQKIALLKELYGGQLPEVDWQKGDKSLDAAYQRALGPQEEQRKALSRYMSAY